MTSTWALIGSLACSPCWRPNSRRPCRAKERVGGNGGTLRPTVIASPPGVLGKVLFGLSHRNYHSVSPYRQAGDIRHIVASTLIRKYRLRLAPLLSRGAQQGCTVAAGVLKYPRKLSECKSGSRTLPEARDRESQEQEADVCARVPTAPRRSDTIFRLRSKTESSYHLERLFVGKLFSCGLGPGAMGCLCGRRPEGHFRSATEMAQGVLHSDGQQRGGFRRDAGPRAGHGDSPLPRGRPQAGPDSARRPHGHVSLDGLFPARLESPLRSRVRFQHG